ncbi:GTP cyclohydrolase I FolE2 [bacterium]|nr:GTP cyclohydrolase I FolE2 [bacterium]
MIDVQNQPDTRNLPINRVGVKDLRYPITVTDRANDVQQTVASINMYVSLPRHFRGTHMSRFIEILNEKHQTLHIDGIADLLKTMKQRLEAHEAHMDVSFPYFIEKTAPISGAKSLMEYKCSYSGILSDTLDFILRVDVPVTSLCPCSKELSDRGAHNQRSIVSIAIRSSDFVWIEELVEIAEAAASSPVYSLLKRSDEKAVTEAAYDNPRFVEDLVREVAAKLNADSRITWYKVESENFESIHNHSAYAAIEKV